jgi:hypothetical protein
VNETPDCLKTALEIKGSQISNIQHQFTSKHEKLFSLWSPSQFILLELIFPTVQDFPAQLD